MDFDKNTLLDLKSLDDDAVFDDESKLTKVEKTLIKIVKLELVRLARRV